MFSVIAVDPAHTEAPEVMGTKPKFWVRHPELGYSLFKAARRLTGEDWSEKVAAEIASALGIPHARYELARVGDAHGTLSPSFVPSGDALVHGNELLVRFNPTYVEFDPSVAHPGYSVEQVFEAVQAAGVGIDPEGVPEGVTTAPGLITGFLMLDALIGNTDRHHENWAAIKRSTADQTMLLMAPTFDHASSLGRTEPEERMRLRVSTSDQPATVEAYAGRARSPFYALTGSRLSPLEAFATASRFEPDAARGWISRLSNFTPERLNDVLQRLPNERVTDTAREFIRRYVAHNRNSLIRLAGDVL